MGNARSHHDIHTYYDIGKVIGKGNFAVVKEAKRKSDGKKFAVKIVKKGNLAAADLELLQVERDIMTKVNHPNCVKLLETFESPKKLYMVMELLTGGELFDRVVAKGNYNEREAAEVTKSVAGALSYIHSIDVVHRDLKPENLLYLTREPDSPIKVTDFGLAKIRSSNHLLLHTACGTPSYVAPEVLRTEVEGTGYGRECDLWSLGVILYILLCGFPPFYHENTRELYKQIKKGQFDFPDPFWTEISKEAKDLVRKLLTVDPVKRYTADQVLSHPWIAEGKASLRSFGSQHTQRLAIIQSRRILKRAVHMIIAANKFLSVVKSLSPEEQQLPSAT